jgi:hypothetical protein
LSERTIIGWDNSFISLMLLILITGEDLAVEEILKISREINDAMSIGMRRRYPSSDSASGFVKPGTEFLPRYPLSPLFLGCHY